MSYVGSATLDSSGRLEVMDECCGGTVGAGDTTFKEFFNDGIITWGRLSDGTLSGIVGTGSRRRGLQLSGKFPLHHRRTEHRAHDRHGQLQLPGRHRSLFRPAKPGIGIRDRNGLGTLTGATMTADFGQNTIAFTLGLKDPSGLAIDFTSWRRQYLQRSRCSLALAPAPAAPGPARVRARVSINGFFAGANSERAGFSFVVDGITHSCGASSCVAVGVVGLKQ